MAGWHRTFRESGGHSAGWSGAEGACRVWRGDGSLRLELRRVVEEGRAAQASVSTSERHLPLRADDLGLGAGSEGCWWLGLEVADDVGLEGRSLEAEELLGECVPVGGWSGWRSACGEWRGSGRRCGAGGCWPCDSRRARLDRQRSGESCRRGLASLGQRRGCGGGARSQARRSTWREWRLSRWRRSS